MISETISPPPPPAPWILPRPAWQARLLAFARAVQGVALSAPFAMCTALAVLIVELGGAR